MKKTTERRKKEMDGVYSITQGESGRYVVRDLPGDRPANVTARSFKYGVAGYPWEGCIIFFMKGGFSRGQADPTPGDYSGRTMIGRHHEEGVVFGGIRRIRR
jgi:hypothetical protein